MTQAISGKARDADSVTVERATAEHAAALRSFFEVEWGAGGEDAHGHGEEMKVTGPSWVCLKSGKAIGYLGTIEAEFRLHGKSVAGHWLKGFWVVPEHRSGPVGYMLLRSALKALGPVAASLVALPARRLMNAAGIAERAVFFNALLILRPVRVFMELDPARVGIGSVPTWARFVWRWLQRTRVGAVPATLMRLGVAGRQLPAAIRSRRLVVEAGWSVDASELDNLWSELRDQVAVMACRDARALFARYRDSGEYDLVTVREGGRLAGWAIVRRLGTHRDQRLGGVRVASLSDILFSLDRVAVGEAAALGAARIAQSMNADALLCSGTHPALARALNRTAFVRIPANLHLLARDGQPHVFANSANELWFTRGDGKADEGF